MKQKTISQLVKEFLIEFFVWTENNNYTATY